MAKKIPQINASSMADISFLLLIFFLVTTSMDVNKGLARRLPPPPQNLPNQEKLDQKINKRNLMIVKINKDNKVSYRDGSMEVGDLQEIHSLPELKAKVKEFILNPSNKPHLPKLVAEDFGAPFGEIEYTKDHVISVQNDVDTQYQAYLDVQDALVVAYNEVREECAMKYYRKHYAELTESEQKLIQKIYPQKISEAEPKNYN